MNNLELDHFFILTDKPKEAGDLLVSFGLKESFSREHKGQGTTNRRFEFSNGMLELLYIRDANEAQNGPARDLKFVERLESNIASPFGIILTRTTYNQSCMPFDGWAYQPDYFEPPKAFHVGNNSTILEEPLCIYVPFMEPIARKQGVDRFSSINCVQFSVPIKSMSETLASLRGSDRLNLNVDSEHLVELILDQGDGGASKDFRPILPLVIHW